MSKSQPSLIEIFEKFNTEIKCIKHFENIRWPKGPECPKCSDKRISQFQAKGKTGKVRHLYECMDCKYQFTVTVGTIFHNSHLPLVKWFLAIYLICSARKGVSAKQLQRELGVTYKTAWYMAHRIRLAMQDDDDFCGKFRGIVEVDETYVGGKRRGKRGRGSANKVPVVAMRERTSGKVRMRALKNVSSSTLQGFIRDGIEAGSEIHTDQFRSYAWIDSSEFTHRAVNHRKAYVDGPVHTNGVENVWSLFKRAIVGVYHKVSAKYLPLYLNEFAYRFNHRHEFNLMDRVLETSF
ncbi:MAG: IS1595 family transposase [Nitrospinae bacterium]|nr:IS1595 family transposase [Nitrospinota bacterium]